MSGGADNRGVGTVSRREYYKIVSLGVYIIFRRGYSNFENRSRGCAT